MFNTVDEKKSKNAVGCNLVLVTHGGSPDAAFKISRFLQNTYKHLVIVVPSYCKSAGTLLALGGHEIVFAPYGELGPLDIQLSKVDKIAGMESGLNISEAFKALEFRARQTYQRVIADILSSSSGVVSFQTASHAATETIGALYGPIFARIDPEEVGSRSRAMRIGEDYGKRLNIVSQNMRDGALQKLSQTYSNHGFVIDITEAQALFYNVRQARFGEIEALKALGEVALSQGQDLIFEKLEDWQEFNEAGVQPDVPVNETSRSEGHSERDAENSSKARRGRRTAA